MNKPGELENDLFLLVLDVGQYWAALDWLVFLWLGEKEASREPLGTDGKAVRSGTK